MYNRESTLQLLKKLAELKAESYEINWEEWEENLDSEQLETMVNAGVEESEKYFMNMKLDQPSDDYDYDNGLDEKKTQELELLIDDLITGYIYQTLLQKKKTIEEFISSI
jgi:hypothetical protein